MTELTRETVDAAIERMKAEPSRPAVRYFAAPPPEPGEPTVTVRHLHKAIAEAVRDVSAENERLRAFAAEQYDQLLEANAEIERLRVSVSTLEAQTTDAQDKARQWKYERVEAERRLEIVRNALVEAGLIEREWDGSEEEETR